MNREELEDIWRRTRTRFDRALAGLVVREDPDQARLESFQANLDHNELELALDDLEELGGRCVQPPEFWEHLRWAAENMGLEKRVRTLRHREEESKRGYVRIKVTLRSREDGGPTNPLLTGVRMPWDVGARHEGSPMLTDATLALEDCHELAPGETATGRLIPTWPEYWNLQPGQRIFSQVGSRRYADAVVIEQVGAWHA